MKRALFSVSIKDHLVPFAEGLAKLGVELLSTGGTAKKLTDAGLKVIEVADYTGFPEMLDGRVKTLHPKIHAGLLARRDLPDHMQAIADANIPTIDILVVNFYPFETTIKKTDCTLAEAIENIDIGGPAAVRSAAKNFRGWTKTDDQKETGGVAVLTDTGDYLPVLTEMQNNNGEISLQTRFELAKKAFATVAAYDEAISEYLNPGMPNPRKICLLASGYFARRDWHRLSSAEHEIIGQLEAQGFLEKMANGFVGKAIRP